MRIDPQEHLQDMLENEADKRDIFDPFQDEEEDIFIDEVDDEDYWLSRASDAEFDADALASCGMGTDEDYGYYGGDEF